VRWRTGAAKASGGSPQNPSTGGWDELAGVKAADLLRRLDQTRAAVNLRDHALPFTYIKTERGERE
jgi:hypothetical protein